MTMRVNTAFGLQNSGALDKGAAVIVTATFMVAFIEMGKPLAPKQLGRGVATASGFWLNGRRNIPANVLFTDVIT